MKTTSSSGDAARRWRVRLPEGRHVGWVKRSADPTQQRRHLDRVGSSPGLRRGRPNLHCTYFIATVVAAGAISTRLRCGASGFQPSSASMTKKPTRRRRHVPAAAAASDRPTCASGIQVGERHAGRRAEPDHRAAEAHRIGQQAPVVAALLAAPAPSAGCCRTRPRRSRGRARSARTASRQLLDRHQRGAQSPAPAGRSVPLKVSGSDLPVGLAQQGRDQDRRPHRQADDRQR